MNKLNLTFTLSCFLFSSFATFAGTPVKFTTIFRSGNVAGERVIGLKVFTDESSFRTYWESDINRVRLSLPKVDFTKNLVVAYDGSRQPIAGMYVKFISVNEEVDKITATVEKKYDNDCGGFHTMSFPVEIISMPISYLTINGVVGSRDYHVKDVDLVIVLKPAC